MDHASVVSVSDVDLFVREMGPDEFNGPPLIAIHGGPDWDHTYLLPGLIPVSRHRRVVMFDMRGCGRSTRGLGPGGYQPELVVEDLAQLTRALEYDTVDILGFSTGGQVAQLFVEAHPKVARRLILASTTAYADAGQYLDGWHEYERRLEFKVQWPAWGNRFLDEDVRGTVRWALDAAPTAIWDLDRLNDYLRLLGDVSFSGEWLRPFRDGSLHAWRPADPEQVLRDFTGPTLVLHGAQDMAFPIQVAQRLRDAVSTASLRIIDRAGHMTHFERPDAWSAAVLEFLAD